MMNNCWDRIGVTGDRSCPELKTVTHCRNCPVYSNAGRSLLEREAPAEYLSEWTEVLTKTSSKTAQSDAIVHSESTVSVMVFRLDDEWLAFPVRLLQEVTQPCVIHTLPHRSNDLFSGLVNIRGEILLCISLHRLLELNPTETAAARKMVVIEQDSSRWVFIVDEVGGFHRFRLDELQNAPVVVSKATEAYTQGVIRWQGRKVNYLDSESLFYTLNRRIL
jgi:chemotaxis-related protein WspD